MDEFLIHNNNKDNNEQILKENFSGSKRGGSRRKIEDISYINKIKKDIKKEKKARKESTKKRKTRGYDNPSLNQAKKREDWPMWEDAINKEYQQMIDEGVFEENKGKFPKGANIIGSMIVLTIKRNQDGTIDKYKARLVCLGNQQDESSYDCIKSGTARSATVKMLVSLQAKTGGVSMVLDVKGAYLKSHVREDIDEMLYVRLPDNRTMKLKKYLYGLKQAGFEWEKNVTACLIAAGYTQSTADPRTFSRWQGKRYIIMCLHVDDFFVLGSDKGMLDFLYKSLLKEYGEVTIKDGDILAYLGMQININKQSGDITLTQPSYTKKLIDMYLDNDCEQEKKVKVRKCETPMAVINSEKDDDDTPVDQREYLMVVGGLNYLAPPENGCDPKLHISVLLCPFIFF